MRIASLFQVNKNEDICINFLMSVLKAHRALCYCCTHVPTFKINIRLDLRIKSTMKSAHRRKRKSRTLYFLQSIPFNFCI